MLWDREQAERANDAWRGVGGATDWTWNLVGSVVEVHPGYDLGAALERKRQKKLVAAALDEFFRFVRLACFGDRRLTDCRMGTDGILPGYEPNVLDRPDSGAH